VALQRRSDGRFLLVKRGDEPVKGYWWVPGGRILRNETFYAAARRKVKVRLNTNAKHHLTSIKVALFLLGFGHLTHGGATTGGDWCEGEASESLGSLEHILPNISVG